MFKNVLARANVTKLVLMEAFVLLLLLVGTASSPMVLASSKTNAFSNLQHTATGTAKLQYLSSSHTLVVTIAVIGLAPKSTHPSHIHLGSCTNPGAIKYMLNDVVADEKGQASTTTFISNAVRVPATGWYINVHNGPGLTTPDQFDPIACGNLENPNGASGVLAPLGPSSDVNKSFNENASGYADLSVKDDKLTVKVEVTGLVPHSKHAIHIHAGDCFYTKGVIYDLSPLIADGSGSANKTITIAGVSSIPQTGWTINVHYSTDLKTQTGYNPILCGNVTPQ